MLSPVSDDLREFVILPGYKQLAFVMKIDVSEMILDFFHRFFVIDFPCVLMLLEIPLHLVERNAILLFSDFCSDPCCFLSC